MDKMGKEKHPGGRPIKFTDVVIEAILEGVRQGLTLKAVCKGAGISYSTLAAWLYRGKVSKKEGIENRFTALLDQIDSATRLIWIEKRKRFFFNLKPRDFVYGWSNPMKPETKKKISDTWKRIYEQNRLICAK
jgi:hypothetical protein